MSLHSIRLLLCVVCLWTASLPVWGEDSESLALFKRRILPILNAQHPSSCAECHLSGVDLKDYIRPSHAETFSALVQGGLVDVQQPDNSKLLQFIKRAPDKPGLIGAEVRKEEFEAFREWLRVSVQDPDLLAFRTNEKIGPQIPEEVIRHARQDRVLTSFLENVWSEVGRCAACHSPDQNQKQVQKHGEHISWIRIKDPQATLDHLLEADLIQIDQPEQSLLLRKPTLQVEHGGGQKMLVGDRTYKQFRRFIDDYAAVRQGKYQTADELPQPSQEVSQVTEIWLKLEGVPAEFDKRLLQIDLYRWEEGAWSTFRVASSDRAVFGPGNLWQHSLSLTAPRGSTWANELPRQKLPPGKYLAKIYVDQTGRLTQDFTATLGLKDFVGQVEFQSQWPAGYGSMTVIQFPQKP